MAAKAKLCALVAARPTKASVSPRVQQVRTVLPPRSSVAYRVVRPLPKPAAVTPMGVVGRSIALDRALPARRVRGRPTRSVPPLSSVCKPRRRSCRSLNDELRASKLSAVGTQHDGRPLTSRGDAFGLSPGAPASLIGRHFKINKTDLRTAFVFEHHTHLIRLIAFVRQLEKGVHRF